MRSAAVIILTRWVTTVSLLYNKQLNDDKGQPDYGNFVVLTFRAVGQSLLPFQQFCKWFRDKMDAHSFLRPNGALSLLSRPPKNPLTSVLVEVFLSNRSAMSFFPESQTFPLRRYESIPPLGLSSSSEGDSCDLPVMHTNIFTRNWKWIKLLYYTHTFGNTHYDTEWFLSLYIRIHSAHKLVQYTILGS